jgi:murein DD-endopeptidase MepM/ murein hydrolase activator NlpD
MNVAFVTIPTASITQKFDNYNPTMYSGDGKHKGLDLGVIAGNPVYVCMDGDVTLAAVSQTGYGRHVRVLHPDGSLSIYGHLSKNLVKVGDHVLAGHEIGKSGGDPGDGIDGDGFSTGPHLHWEIRPPGQHGTDQMAVDPMEWCCRYITNLRREAIATAYLGLRVRSTPVIVEGNWNVIRSLPNRTTVDIIEEIDGWSRILSTRPEWCSSEYLSFTGNVTGGEPTPPAIITDAEKLERLWAAHKELHT